MNFDGLFSDVLEAFKSNPEAVASIAEFGPVKERDMLLLDAIKEVATAATAMLGGAIDRSERVIGISSRTNAFLGSGHLSVNQGNVDVANVMLTGNSPAFRPMEVTGSVGYGRNDHRLPENSEVDALAQARAELDDALQAQSASHQEKPYMTLKTDPKAPEKIVTEEVESPVARVVLIDEFRASKDAYDDQVAAALAAVKDIHDKKAA